MHLIEKVSNKLVESEIITEEDKEIYSYGLYQGVMLILNVISILVVGVAFGMIAESIIFFTAYFVLRPYAGGYHASTQLRCYLISMLLYVLSLGFIKLIPSNVIIYIFLWVVTSSIIVYLAPVEHVNKPLDEREQVVYKRKTRNIIIIFTLLNVLLLYFQKYNIVNCFITVNSAVTVMLLLGKKILR